MPQNILFLDFDGPLWPDRVIKHHPDNRNMNHPARLDLIEMMNDNGDTFGAATITYWRMDETAVGMLNQIMEIQPFVTVISSSWKEFCSRDTIEYIMDINGLELELHQHWAADYRGMCSKGENRGLAISKWLSDHRDEVGSYAVLDDPGSGGDLIDDSFVRHIGLQSENVVLVNYMIGMELEHFTQLRGLLTV